MIAQISKYSNEQILAAAACLLTSHQTTRLTKAASQMLPISAVLTLTVLAESDYEQLVSEVSQSSLKETAVERALATMAQFESAEQQQFAHMLPFALTSPNSGYNYAPNSACFEESAIREIELLSQLELLYGSGEAIC
ncbi:MAG: hypothetical protein WCT03_16680 [Candidatus Obscuribacterales bacterium]|jgi:hypothetical protein